MTPAVDFTRLMQAYLLARSLSSDPHMSDADRICCHIIAILIREASGESATTWGNVAAGQPAESLQLIAAVAEIEAAPGSRTAALLRRGTFGLLMSGGAMLHDA